MVLASGIRRLRVLGVLCIGLIALAVVAPSRQRRDTRVVTGGETRLEVNIAGFVKLLGDGIFITPIAPAQLVFGSNPAAIFPASTGVADAVLQDRDRPAPGRPAHREGQHRFLPRRDQRDARVRERRHHNVAGCRLLNTANGLLPERARGGQGLHLHR